MRRTSPETKDGIPVVYICNAMCVVPGLCRHIRGHLRCVGCQRVGDMLCVRVRACERASVSEWKRVYVRSPGCALGSKCVMYYVLCAMSSVSVKVVSIFLPLYSVGYMY